MPAETQSLCVTARGIDRDRFPKAATASAIAIPPPRHFSRERRGFVEYIPTQTNISPNLTTSSRPTPPP